MKFFKRLTFAFALFALGSLAAVWGGLRAVATNVMNDKTAPVRASYVADWAAHADVFERDLGTAETWVATSERAPVSLGCHLPWAGDATPVQQHHARCPKRTPLSPELVEHLEALGGALLKKEEPPVTEDFTWLRALQGHTDWSQATGTPLEFFDVNPQVSSVLDVPVLDRRQLHALVALRLLQGQQTGALPDAAADVTVLGRALLSRPVTLDQLLGVAVLQQLRTELEAVGTTELAPPADVIEALRQTRLASALLWHPWTPSALRTRFTPKIANASRCAASAEAAMHEELGTLAKEYDPTWVDALHGARVQAPCDSDFTQRLVAARATVPADVARRLLRSTEPFSGDELKTALMLRATESSALVRRAAVESYLALTLARPFPESASQSPK